jgi:hypothetical protein
MTNEAELRQLDVLNNSAVGNFDVHLSKKNNNISANYIKITAGEESYYFRVKDEDGYPEKYFIANTKSFTFNGLKAVDGKPGIYRVTYEPADKSQWLTQKVKYDPEQVTAFVGLILGAVGLAIDACFDIGKVKPLFYFAPHDILICAPADETLICVPYVNWVVVIKFISWVLKIVGLFLVFWKGLISPK